MIWKGEYDFFIQSNMITVGILGYGYWGPNLVRNFVNIGCNVKRVVDMNEQRLQTVNSLYPNILTSSNSEDIFNDDDISAVIIALPVWLHYIMAKRALESGKHVLVEKPMTDNSDHARELIVMAKDRNLVLMVDHTFLYTSAVRKIKALVNNGELGRLHYFDSNRINLGQFRSDINVIWDLAPHDISILKYLFDKNPVGVVATGVAHTQSELENIAFMTMFYNDDFIAHANVSWVSPVKLRTVLIGGDKKMVLYDDNEPTEKIRVYDSGYSVKDIEGNYAMRVDYRVGDIYIPKLAVTEALKEMALDFVHCVETGATPESDASLGLTVVQVLEAAQKSIKNRGREESLC